MVRFVLKRGPFCLVRFVRGPFCPSTVRVPRIRRYRSTINPEHFSTFATSHGTVSNFNLICVKTMSKIVSNKKYTISTAGGGGEVRPVSHVGGAKIV